jgi:hypothetical protein
LISKRKLLALAAAAAAVSLLTSWPLATWLQYPEVNIAREAEPDIVYLVAGARHQNRRVAALGRYLRKRVESRLAGAGGSLPLLLIGNDTTVSRWSDVEERNLTKAEWAVKKTCAELGLSSSDCVISGDLPLGPWSVRAGSGEGPGEPETPLFLEIAIVPGHPTGTDGEMNLLASHLAGLARVRSLCLVTSAFHIRRTVRRLNVHLERDIRIHALRAAPHWTDRAPWTVLIESAKLVRDRVGLTRAPLLCRDVYMRLLSTDG